MEPTGQELLAQLKRGQISPEVVKLSSCKLNDDQASQLADILKINKTIKSIYLEGNSIKDGGAKALGEALKSNTTLEYMNISNNSITFDGAREIFRGLKINRSLRGVDFANNNLHSEDPNQRDIFVVFQFNKTLQYLNLSNDKLSPSTMLRICEGLVLNKSLQWLDVSGNNFDDSIADTLRDGLAQNSSITHLNIGSNPLGPNALGGIGDAAATNRTLTELRLNSLPAMTRDGLVHLLSVLESSSTVTALDLADNSVPPTIGDFISKNTSIVKLNLHRNLIRNNELTAIAKALEVNTTLRHLNLSDNLARQEAITVFANSLRVNTVLEVLDFSNTTVGEGSESLADGIKKSKGLKVLHLNNLKDMTTKGRKMLIQMLAADKLPLIYFSMNSVGLGEIEAKELVRALKFNTKLEELSVKGNAFSSVKNSEIVPQLLDQFVTSPSLIRLEMDVTDPRLAQKNLEGKALSEFPLSLLKMTQLVSLNLANNFIARIPEGISKLVDLTDLNISSNRLLSLPPAMGFLNNLRTLQLKGNSFQTPPPEILNKGAKQILGFLRDLAKGAEPIYRVKLMMVGQENVGKTTLLKMIKRRRQKKGTAKKGIKTISTDGIDIEEWQMEVDFDQDPNASSTGATSAPISATALLQAGLTAPQSVVPAEKTSPTPPSREGRATLRPSLAAKLLQQAEEESGTVRRLVTVSAWDFAGQEIYYTTHQFFLSERSIYILVWDLRFDDDECKVSYWLQSIRSRTKGAPVIIVGTHLDDFKEAAVAEAKVKEVQRKYKKRFPFICGVLAVACKPDSDIGNLMNRIRDVIAMQEHMGEEIPKTYLELERLIKQEKQLVKEGKAKYPPIRKWEEIKVMASYCHIHEEEELRRCINLLHDLGQLIHFDDPSLGVQDLVIIDSQFLTNVMSTIITTKTSIRDGLLDHKLLPMIWRAPDFPPDIHEVLLSLLEKFEIVYTLPPQLRARLVKRPELMVSAPVHSGKERKDAKSFGSSAPLPAAPVPTLTVPESSNDGFTGPSSPSTAAIDTNPEYEQEDVAVSQLVQQVLPPRPPSPQPSHMGGYGQPPPVASSVPPTFGGSSQPRSSSLPLGRPASALPAVPNSAAPRLSLDSQTNGVANQRPAPLTGGLVRHTSTGGGPPPRPLPHVSGHPPVAGSPRPNMAGTAQEDDDGSVSNAGVEYHQYGAPVAGGPPVAGADPAPAARFARPPLPAQPMPPQQGQAQAPGTAQGKFPGITKAPPGNRGSMYGSSGVAGPPAVPGKIPPGGPKGKAPFPVAPNTNMGMPLPTAGQQGKFGGLPPKRPAGLPPGPPTPTGTPAGTPPSTPPFGANAKMASSDQNTTPPQSNYTQLPPRMGPTVLQRTNSFGGASHSVLSAIPRSSTPPSIRPPLPPGSGNNSPQQHTTPQQSPSSSPMLPRQPGLPPLPPLPQGHPVNLPPAHSPQLPQQNGYTHIAAGGAPPNAAGPQSNYHQLPPNPAAVPPAQQQQSSTYGQLPVLPGSAPLQPANPPPPVPGYTTAPGGTARPQSMYNAAPGNPYHTAPGNMQPSVLTPTYHSLPPLPGAQGGSLRSSPSSSGTTTPTYSALPPLNPSPLNSILSSLSESQSSVTSTPEESMDGSSDTESLEQNTPSSSTFSSAAPSAEPSPRGPPYSGPPSRDAPLLPPSAIPSSLIGGSREHSTSTGSNNSSNASITYGEKVTLIPSLLSEDRPDSNLLWRSSDPSKTQYDRKYQLEFVPKGLFSRLIIRLLHLVDDVLVYWRNGLIATKDRDMFLLELRPGEALLKLIVRGPKTSPPTETLRMCVETIEVLIGLNNWFNIKVNKLVPCPHCVENQTPEPDQWNFRLSDLASLAAKGTWVAECTANPQDKKAIQLTRLVPDMALSDLDMVKIPYEELVLSEEVGKGAFGVIHRATWYTLDVAVKSLVSMQQEDQRQKAFEEFRREVWVMSGMKHPNLVNLLGFCVDPFAIVMEFIPYGNLHHYLRDKTKPLDWSLRLKIALDIAKGMYYLHDATPPFIHRDLKSPNILLVDLDPNAEVTAKIGDFGLSSRMYVPSLKENSKDRDVVNPTWLAPEIIREEEFTEKSDVYSYGIILWELLTGAHPFGEFQFQFMFELEDLVKRGGRPTMPADAPTDFATLIRRCWSGDPNERPAFLEIITSLIAIAAEMAPALYIPEDILQTNKQGTAGTWARIDTGDGTDGPALTGQFLKQIKTNPVTKVYSLLQCTGNQMWAGTRDGSILIYNTENGQLMARNENIHKQQINTMILANRRVWTHSWGEDIKIWKLLDQEQVRQALVAAEKTSEETYLQIRSSGVTKKLKRRFVVLKNKRMIIYKFDTDKAPQSIIELPGALIAEEKSPKRCGFELRALNNKPLQFVCKDKAEQAEWFNLVKTEIDRQEKQYDLELVSKIEVSDVHCITVLDGKVWAGTTELRLKVFDPETFQLVKNVSVNFGAVMEGIDMRGLFINNIIDYDGRLWLSVQKYLVCLDKESLIPLRVLPGHSLTITAIVGYENRIWTCSEDCSVRVWDSRTYECLQTFSDFGGKLFTMIRSGSSLWMAGWDGSISIYSGKTCQLVKNLEQKHQDAISCFALGLDSVWAGSWDGSISVWG